METIERARTGDRPAIATMWRVYQPQLLRLLRAKRAGSPEDVASQVWVDVGRSLVRFEGDGTDFRKWLFTVARRRSIDGHRRAARDAVIGIDDRRCELVERGAEQAFIDGDDSLERALTIVRQLSPATAEAVMLRVIFDHSVADVAEITGRSEGAVRVLVHRGLRRLNVLLGDDVEHRDAEPGEKMSADDVTHDVFPALT